MFDKQDEPDLMAQAQRILSDGDALHSFELYGRAYGTFYHALIEQQVPDQAATMITQQLIVTMNTRGQK